MGSYISVMNNNANGAWVYCTYIANGDTLPWNDHFSNLEQQVAAVRQANAAAAPPSDGFPSFNQLSGGTGTGVDSQNSGEYIATGFNSWQETFDFFQNNVAGHLNDYGLHVRKGGEAYVSEKVSLSLMMAWWAVKLTIDHDPATGKWRMILTKGYLTCYSGATADSTKSYNSTDATWGEYAG